MITLENFLFYLQYFLILVAGILMSFFFAGVHLAWKNVLISLIPITVCSVAQIVAYKMFSEQTVWELYPILVHVPTLLMLMLVWRKRAITSIAAITTAYLLCHPAKWLTYLVQIVTSSEAVSMISRIILVIVISIASIIYLSPYISQLFNRRLRSVLVFSIIPVTYYLFDYITSVWSMLWEEHTRTTSEFFPFILCIAYIVFLFFYYKAQEQAEIASQNEQLFRFQYEQKEKEYSTIKQAEQELRLMRHDMRLHLNNLAICLENNDIESAKSIIDGLSSCIEHQKIKRYSDNAIINYILSDFETRARQRGIAFSAIVELPEIELDESRFSAILSNALENALLGQDDVPPEERYIKIMLKYYNNKLLFSVRNPISKKPVFADGLPIASKIGHGYGTQSIRYLSEYLGGNCHFQAKNGVFLVRVII